jgi:hypothetical protein
VTTTTQTTTQTATGAATETSGGGGATDPPTPWAKSRAKALARELLLDPNSYVHGMPSTHVHPLEELFSRYNRGNFASNFNSLKKAIEVERLAIEFESLGFEKEKSVFKRNPLNCRGQPFWDTHPAKKLLVDELKNGVHIGREPQAIRATRDEYKEFNLDTFRNYYYREKRALREAVYWQAKRNRKGQKKREKELVQAEEVAT